MEVFMKVNTTILFSILAISSVSNSLIGMQAGDGHRKNTNNSPVNAHNSSSNESNILLELYKALDNDINIIFNESAQRLMLNSDRIALLSNKFFTTKQLLNDFHSECIKYQADRKNGLYQYSIHTLNTIYNRLKYRILQELNTNINPSLKMLTEILLNTLNAVTHDLNSILNEDHASPFITQQLQTYVENEFLNELIMRFKKECDIYRNDRKNGTYAYPIEPFILLSKTLMNEILNEKNLLSSSNPASAIQAVTMQECSICMEEKTSNEFCTLSCGHEFCTECLQTMLDNAVTEKQSSSLRCPNPTCKRSIEDSDISKINNNIKKINLLNDIKLQEWLLGQKGVKHCTTPNCSFSFINEKTDQFTMKCAQCAAEYCAQCLFPHAWNVSCTEAALASDKNAAEKASEQWELSNTKPCPKCKAKIEKNGGCKHMKCGTCKFDFCWNCLQEWRPETHFDYYHCANREVSPLQPRVIAQPHENINSNNAHLLFARDPRGIFPFLDSNLTQLFQEIQFLERFMNLTCERQDEWAAQIEQLLENGTVHYWYVKDVLRLWVQALQTMELANTEHSRKIIAEQKAILDKIQMKKSN